MPGPHRLLSAVALGAGLAAGTMTPALAQAGGSARASLAGMSPKTLYLLRCSGCHRPDGGGAVSAGVPPFPGFIGPMTSDPMGRTYVTHVPGITGSGLSDAQIASVLNYVLDRWSTEGGSISQPFTVEEVAERRAVPVSDIVSYRRALVARLTKRGLPVGDYPWP